MSDKVSIAEVKRDLAGITLPPLEPQRDDLSPQFVLGICAAHTGPHQAHPTCVHWKQEQVYPAKSPEQTAAPNPELRFEMSNGIGTLIGALAKARKEFKPVIKDSANPFFKSKYADLSAVIEATKEGLSANGLAVLQPPAFERSTGTVEVLTLLAHTSGEWIKSILHMPINKTDAQGVGSAITYGRRYAYSAVLNVASEEDDDGNAAVSGEFKKPIKEHEKAFEERESKQPPADLPKPKPNIAEGFVILDKISVAKTQKGVEYWKMEVTDMSGHSSMVAVYDKKLWLPELWSAAGKDLRLTIKAKDVAGKTYYDLVSIQQIGSNPVVKEEIPMFDGE